MPRFDANLSFMFNEVPFLDRFAEAAQAGFRAVEFTSPYDYDVHKIASRVRDLGLEVVLFNAALGDWAGGERGLGSLASKATSPRRIGHVQIAGVPGRHEPDQGEIHYPYLFRLLDELHYDGWVGCEYRPLAGTAEGLAWFYRLIERRGART